MSFELLTKYKVFCADGCELGTVTVDNGDAEIVVGNRSIELTEPGWTSAFCADALTQWIAALTHARDAYAAEAKAIAEKLEGARA